MFEQLTNASSVARAVAREGYSTATRLEFDRLVELRQTYARFGIPDPGLFTASVFVDDREYRERVAETVWRSLRPSITDALPGYDCIGAGFVTKRARTPSSALPFHQDWSFVDPDAVPSLGVWCPLVDVAPSNGCWQVFPRSHEMNNSPRGQRTPEAYRQFFHQHRRCSRALELAAGTILVFDHRLVHGSFPNVSAFDRPAAYAILAPRDARLVFYHQDDAMHPGFLERFEVRADFYQTYAPPTRPALTGSTLVPHVFTSVEDFDFSYLDGEER